MYKQFSESEIAALKKTTDDKKMAFRKAKHHLGILNFQAQGLEVTRTNKCVEIDLLVEEMQLAAERGPNKTFDYIGRDRTMLESYWKDKFRIDALRDWVYQVYPVVSLEMTIERCKLRKQVVRLEGEVVAADGIWFLATLGIAAEKVRNIRKRVFCVIIVKKL